MKKILLFMSMILGVGSAMANTVSAKVCSVGRNGQIYTTEFRADESQAVLIEDGVPLHYKVEFSAKGNLRSSTAIAGEKVIEATDYVLSSPQGTTVLQMAVTASGARHMIFPENGILGASSGNCR